MSQGEGKKVNKIEGSTSQTESGIDILKLLRCAEELRKNVEYLKVKK